MVKLCRNCCYSIEAREPYTKLVCVHPEVIKKNALALASHRNETYGVECTTERGKTFGQFPACGMKGKLFAFASS